MVFMHYEFIPPWLNVIDLAPPKFAAINTGYLRPRYFCSSILRKILLEFEAFNVCLTYEIYLHLSRKIRHIGS